MQIIQENWHIICYEEFKYLENKSLKSFVEEKKYLNILKNLKTETILVLGWDWTLLSAIREFQVLERPFLWLNFWTKWFLLNDLWFINSKNFVEKKYPLLEFELKTTENKEIFYSFNEFDIRAWNWRIITLEISLNWKNILISWDWIIVSTPAGSTWYNNSLGWPIIPHNVDAFVITSKAPYIPKWQNPILVSWDSEINIRNIWRKNTLQIYSDSNLVYEWIWESVCLKTKKSKKSVTFLIFKDYLEKWEEKVLFEQGFWK